MFPLISCHWWRDWLNKNENIERLGDKQKHAACCEVCVVEKKQTWQWRETPRCRRGKNTLMAAKDVQSSVSLYQKRYTVFPLCSSVAETAAVIKRARHNFRCCGPRKPQTTEIIRVPDSNLNALIYSSIWDTFEWVSCALPQTVRLSAALRATPSRRVIKFHNGLLAIDAECDKKERKGDPCSETPALKYVNLWAVCCCRTSPRVKNICCGCICGAIKAFVMQS